MPTTIPDEYLFCRMAGHAWEPTIDTAWAPAFGYGLAFACRGCGMHRYDTIDSLGRVAARSYARPDGYAMTRNETPTRAQMRQQYIRTRPRFTHHKKD